jgi:hypothetical protein
LNGAIGSRLVEVVWIEVVSKEQFFGSVASFRAEQEFAGKASFRANSGGHFEEFVDEPILQL